MGLWNGYNSNPKDNSLAPIFQKKKVVTLLSLVFILLHQM